MAFKIHKTIHSSGKTTVNYLPRTINEIVHNFEGGSLLQFYLTSQIHLVAIISRYHINFFNQSSQNDPNDFFIRPSNQFIAFTFMESHTVQ